MQKRMIVGRMLAVAIVLATAVLPLPTTGVALAQSAEQQIFLPYVGQETTWDLRNIGTSPEIQDEVQQTTEFGPRLQAAADLACPETCIGFPDTDSTTGQFVNVTRGLSSLGNVGAEFSNLHLRVPKASATFQLSIFDADVGGLWDRLGSGPPVTNPLFQQFNTTFHLYPDPNLARNTASGEIALLGGGGYTPVDADDNTWVNFIVTNGPASPTSLNPCNTADAFCYYHLVVAWTVPALGEQLNVQNNFKVAVEGTPFLLAGSTIGFVGLDSFVVPAGPPFADYTFLPTDYMEDGGRFMFFIDVPSGQQSIDVWDGDFDLVIDTDDNQGPNNSPALPPTGAAQLFHSLAATTMPEGARPGVPADNFGSPAYRVPPNVFYTIESPDGSWLVENRDPSGDQEWELFRIATVGAPGATPDKTVTAIPGGTYRWEIQGLDRENTIFVTSQFNLLPAAEIGDTVWIDKNNNGIWEPGTDTPVENALVELYQNHVLVQSMLTNANGFYLFTGLDASDYEVRVSTTNFDPGGVLEGFVPSPNVFPDADVFASDDLNRGSSHAVRLDMVESYRLADFAYVAGETICLWDPDNPAIQANVTYIFGVDAHTGANTVTIRVTIGRGFADTAYGPNSTITGWPGSKGRKFDQILGSDNLELLLKNTAGQEVLKFEMDLLAKDSAAPSGYRTGGVLNRLEKSDGNISTGDVAWIMDVKTSISENLNNTLWSNIVSSPLVDSNYNFAPSVVNPLVLALWDWSTWYEVTIDLSAFGGPDGFDTAWVPYAVFKLHSSPSKTGDNSPSVEPCPGDKPPEPETCNECDGKVTRLNMQYLGIQPAFVQVYQKKGHVLIFDSAGQLQPGTEFTFAGTDKKGTMGTEIEIYVNGSLHTSIHTSCSQPIGPGLVAGDFLVTEGESRNGGLLCPLNVFAAQPIGTDYTAGCYIQASF